MERFYLDTNIIFSYFLKKFAERKGKQIEAKVANFPFHSSKKMSYAVSILTKAEIMRKLRSEFGLEEDEIINMWKGFILDVSPFYISVSQPLEEIMRKSLTLLSSYQLKEE
ncbi:MAG: hypothetical protein LM587_03370 [Candidatus Aenigmarchaeota archaeon]|nr:hypothetical protein [Candidatus Aenigmarchaeota archaeon]